MDNQGFPHSIGAKNEPTQPMPETRLTRFVHNRAVVIGIDRYQHIRSVS